MEEVWDSCGTRRTILYWYGLRISPKRGMNLCRMRSRLLGGFCGTSRSGLACRGGGEVVGGGWEGPTGGGKSPLPLSSEIGGGEGHSVLEPTSRSCIGSEQDWGSLGWCYGGTWGRDAIGPL